MPHDDLSARARHIALEGIRRGRERQLSGTDLARFVRDHVARECTGDESLARAAAGWVAALLAEPAPVPPLPTPPSPESRPFGEYRLFEKLGEGSQGVVYRAEQGSYGRMVALKMLRPGVLATPEARERFVNEVRLAGKLTNPGIVWVIDVGEVDGECYYTMVYVEGQSLADRLRGPAGAPAPRFALREAARLVQQAAHAVAHAHDRGIVHRDLKPANILLDRNSTPYVTDFGVARALGEAGEAGVFGTPAYMEPEQFVGDSKGIGPATDVWALGVILYELLAGRRPFPGKDWNELRQLICQGAPQPLGSDGVPRDLEAVCLKCLNKDPQKRYDTAGALAEDLRRYLADEPVKARPASPPERLAKWARRNPGLAGGIAAAVCVFAAAFVVVALSRQELKETNVKLGDTNHKLDEALIDANDEKEKEKKARKRADDALAEADANDHVLRIELSHRDLRSGNVTAAEELLDGCLPDLRGWEWRHLKRLCHPELIALRHQGVALRAAFSPDGQRVVTSGDFQLGFQKGALTTWDVRTGQPLFTFGKEYPDLKALAISPDGSRIAGANYRRPGQKQPPGDVIVWAAATGAVELTLAGHAGAVAGLAFAPDGKRLASAGHDGTVKVWDLDRGGLDYTLGGHAKPVNCVAYSPDGKHLASGAEDGIVKVWDATAHKALQSFTTHEGAVTALAYSPNPTALQIATVRLKQKEWLLTAGSDGSIKVADPLAGQSQETVVKEDTGVEEFCLSPDGRRIAYTTVTSKSFKVWDIKTGAVTIWKGHTESVKGLAYSADGRRLLSASIDGTARAWDATGLPGAHVTEVTAGPEGRQADAVALSPDGLLLAASAKDNTVWLTGLGGRGEPRALTGHTLRAQLGAFSRDGTRLVTLSKGRDLSTPPAKPAPDGEVIVWDVTAGRALLTLQPSADPVRGVAFSPDGKTLAAGRKGGAVEFHDVATGSKAQTMETGDRDISLVAFSPDGSLVAAAGYESVTLWEVASGRAARRVVSRGFLSSATSMVMCLAFSDDGRLLATGGSTFGPPTVGELKLWEVATGGLVANLSGHPSGLTCVAFSHDGRRVVSGSRDKTLKVWDVGRGKELLTLEANEAGARQVLFTPDDSRLVSTSPFEHEVLVFDGLPRGRDVLALHGFTTYAADAAFSPDGKMLAASDGQAPLRLWEAATGRPVWTSGTPAHEVYRIAWDPTGKRLATASLLPIDGGEVKLYDVASGREELTLPGHTCVAFDPVRPRLACAALDPVRFVRNSGVALAGGLLLLPWAGTVPYPPLFPVPYGDEIVVYDTEARREVFRLPGRVGLTGLAFGPDGKYVAATASGRAVLVWDAETGALVRTLEGHRAPVFSLAFHPDGRRLATGSSDGVIRVRDVTSGEDAAPPLRRVESSDGVAHSLAFSPDGRYLAAATAPFLAGFLPGPVRLWDLQTGDECFAYRGHTGGATCVQFSPDGRRAVSYGADRTVRVWDAFPPTGDDLRAWHAAEAALYEGGKNWSEALLHLDWLIRDRPQDGTLYSRRGHAYVTRGDLARNRDDTEKGLADCRRAIELKAGGADVYYDIANGQFTAERWNEVIAAADEAIKRGATRWEVWTLRGGANIKRGDHDEEALKDLDESIKRGDRNASTRGARGICLLRLGRFAEAADELEQAELRGLGDHLAIRGNRGWALGELGRYAEAVTEFDRDLALVKDAKEYEEQGGLVPGAALAHLGAKDVAGYKRVVRRGLDLLDRAEDPALTNEAAWACVLQPGAVDDYGPVLRLAKRAADGDPKSYVFARTLGTAYLRAGRLDDAAAELTRAAGLQERSASVGFLLAVVRHRLGKGDEAKAFDRAARQMDEALKAAAKDPRAALPWTERLQLSLFREEAGALLKRE
jgi:WD40 repeat protein/serine/threonine protein kinase/tetratricopeptide (TPR) repeat protein